jgi:hypothetical protein
MQRRVLVFYRSPYDGAWACGKQWTRQPSIIRKLFSRNNLRTALFGSGYLGDQFGTNRAICRINNSRLIKNDDRFQVVRITTKKTP